jgi:CubicO group peptidase (beta-lactamase class C family)
MGDGSGLLAEADSLTDEEGRAVFRWELGDAWENTVSVALLEHQGVRITVRAWARYRSTVPEAVDDGWETASLSSVGLSEEPVTRMMDSLRAGRFREVHSVLIVRDHRLVHEAYFPGHDFGYGSANFLGPYVEWNRNRPHNTHSATKSIISTLMGLAIDDGFVPDEEERVFDYFPDYAEYAVGGKEAITVRDMLTMTSGLEWPEWTTPVGGGLSPIEEFNNSPDPIGYVLSRPLVNPPGTVFNYNGGTVNVLCQLVSRAAGTRVEEFAGEHLFWPMGITNFRFPTHFTGLTVCHGDIYITPRDLAKFGQLYLDGGVWNGVRILSEEWIRKSVSPLISVRNFNLYWASDYGYLWWLNGYTVDGKTYSTYKAIGWGGQEVWVVPEEEMVVIFTGANYTTNPPTDEIMTRFVFPALEG